MKTGLNPRKVKREQQPAVLCGGSPGQFPQFHTTRLRSQSKQISAHQNPLGPSVGIRCQHWVGPGPAEGHRGVSRAPEQL